MPKLLLFYLTDHRRHYTFRPFLDLLCNSTKKDDWVLLVLTHDNDTDFYYNEMIHRDIYFNLFKTEAYNNYLVKVNYAIQFAENNAIPYMMKCDNDIFLTPHTFDFIIQNLELLNTDKHLTLSPVLSSGIPTVEYFMEQFLDESAKKRLQDEFLNVRFSEICGADYTFLNKYTIESKEWDKRGFFDAVREMQHHYKGIHPIRLSNPGIQLLNDYIIENKDRFLAPQTLSIIQDDQSPYLCNSIFAIKRDTYKQIVNDPSLYVDSFEEVPVNKYAWNHKMNHLFVKNGFAIHMYYNWTPNHQSYEALFCGKFF